ncbi:hypothetical protein CEUSTIGMA_g8682.t1 [Chlamydomonas eustigma]|uniref:Calpain catalytic domain-containing protein n=1 Tax=Chlamydomonas eustigma TaxID=1157962 RepID=A0A250XEP1_9CHLO|nr:hypothetical protein CEUSTIGMA_g8682.t1 [Chlamydomonas eustigma]|eukprot:GAX81250.1 hypothetical protein CEUSTIGMA_g8682.t1 [Chlamydomonas eustigma]
MTPGIDSRPGTSGGKRNQGDNLASVASRLKSPMYVSDRAMPPEAETIRSIESKLQIGGGAQSEESFVMNNCGPEGLCVDSAFPPAPSSLYPDPNQLPVSAKDPIVWKRLTGAMYIPTSRTPKFLQSNMDNHQFLGALAAVSLKQDLLLDLIVSDDHAMQGAFTLQFYKHGCWHQVTVDNLLPCLDDPDDPRVAFACSSNSGELWPSLLEKAYAKVHGSYYALEGGSIGDILVDLTGGVVTKYRLDTFEGKKLAKTNAVWDQVCAALAGGSIIVCQGKSSRTEKAEPFLGLVRGKCYSVMEARGIPEGPLLLRLHCPWATGVWVGAWSNGSHEWQLPTMQSHQSHFAESLEDDATFWIAYEDFVSFFDRLHICRLFPASWHQLTLHCGWQGPSAGGPYFYRVGGEESTAQSPSSTWCCNPQFRITVRKSCDIIICLGQQDPRVVNRRHVKKLMRKQSIGLQVLRVPLSSLGRRWDVKNNELLQEVALTPSREASTSFRAEPDSAYIVVPYAGKPGEEGAFVLRAFSSAPLEMEQLPSPLSLVLGGHWQGYLAGGPKTASTFGSNPQYMISCRQRTQVVVSASRLDNRYAILKPAYSKDQCVGLMVLQPEKNGVEGGMGRCTSIKSQTQVLGEFGFNSMDEAVAMVTLEPETPCIVMPCLASAGLEAPYELRIMSGVPVELVPLPEVKCMVVKGSWGPETSGGCDLSPVWKRNPRFLLVLKENKSAKITLTRSGRDPKKLANVDDMIGFYILLASEPNGEIRGDLRRAIVFETTFVTTFDVTADKELKGGMPYIIMPCTYSPGRQGKFSMAVTSSIDFDLMEL